jgi:hypothetical protein
MLQTLFLQRDLKSKPVTDLPHNPKIQHLKTPKKKKKWGGGGGGGAEKMVFTGI